MKLKYDYVKKNIENTGYKLLSTEYKNAREKLKVVCNKGHEYFTTYDRFSNNHYCPYCNGNAKTSLDDIKKFIGDLNFKLIDDNNFKNSKTKITLQCDKGHIFKTSWNIFHYGHGCPVCNGGLKLTYKIVKDRIEKFNYKLLSTEYKNALTKITLQCDKGHKYDTAYSNFHKGSRCPYCSNSKIYSKGEKEVLEYIKTFYQGKIIENDRTQIINPLTDKYLELDIWLPELNLAIEYNGLYFHSSEDSKYRDTIKINECNNKGILLYIIMDDEWNNNKDFVKKKLDTLII